MGIRRRQLGAILEGLGAGGQTFASVLLRQQQQQQQQDFEREKLREGSIRDLRDKIATDPSRYDLLAQGAQTDPLLRGFDVSGLRPSPDVLLRGLSEKLNTAATPEAMPADIGAAASSMGVNMPSATLGNAAQFGGQSDYANLPPELQKLMAVATSRLGQLQQAQEGAVEDLGRKKFAEAQGTTAGTNAANTANFPMKLSQMADELYTKGPIEADNAGQVTGAQDRAALAPDIVQGQAGAAGVKAGAEARARLAAEYDPQAIAGAATKAGEIAKADALAKGDTQKLKYIETAKENGVLLGAQISRLMNLYDQAKTGDVAAMKLYSDLSDQLRPVIARSSGYNGRMTNLEMGIAGKAIPGVMDRLLGTADNKWKFLRGLATYGPTIVSKMPPDASIDEYMNAVQRLVDQEPPPAGKGGGNIISATPIHR